MPFAPERLLAELEGDPQVRHLGTFNQVEHPLRGTVRGVNRPVRFDGDNDSAFLPPPAMGEHSDEILVELGLDKQRIGELRARKII